MGVQGCRDGLRVQMDYCAILARVLFDAGACPARARDIIADPRFLGLYRGYLCEMMSLM